MFDSKRENGQNINVAKTEENRKFLKCLFQLVYGRIQSTFSLMKFCFSFPVDEFFLIRVLILQLVDAVEKTMHGIQGMSRHVCLKRTINSF